MNITIITPGGVDKSGRDRVVPALLWLIERLAREHRVLVIALHQYPEFVHYQLLGADVVNLGRVRGRVTELKILTRLRQLHAAFRLTNHQPDLFHVISLGECGSLAAAAGALWRVPVIGSIWSGELTWLPEIGYGWQKNWRTRLPVTLTTRAVKTITGGSQFVLKQLQTVAGERLARKELTSPQSPGSNLSLSQSLFWLPLGVDTKRLMPVSRRFGPPWRLIHVANLNPVKDQSMLLRAMCRLVEAGLDFHLDIVGQDTLRGRVQIEARVLNLTDRVHFHGFKPINKLIPLYQQAHLFLQSSLHESQGVAVLEAAATGAPPIGTAVGLIPELAPAAAAVVPVGDDTAMAAAIQSLLADRARWEGMSAAATAFATTYDADWTAAQFSQLYTALSQRKST